MLMVVVWRLEISCGATETTEEMKNKDQHPTSKLQRSFKLQIPNCALVSATRDSALGSWCFSGSWMLMLGAWRLVLTCGATETTEEMIYTNHHTTSTILTSFNLQ